MLTSGGCGGSDDAPDAAAASTPAATVSPTPGAKAGTPAKAKPATKAKPTVPPEVVAAPSTTDAKSEQVLSGDWETKVVAALRGVDARLVTDQPAAIKKVRATCKQMETGMFSTKVIPIIVKRFSNDRLTVSQDMAQDIYSVLIQDACYLMSGS